MYINNLRLTDYWRNPLRALQISVNAAHITIHKSNYLLYKRNEPFDERGEWYDEGHRRIVNALAELEAAIFAVIEPVGEPHKEE